MWGYPHMQLRIILYLLHELAQQKREEVEVGMMIYMDDECASHKQYHVAT